MKSTVPVDRFLATFRTLTGARHVGVIGRVAWLVVTLAAGSAGAADISAAQQVAAAESSAALGSVVDAETLVPIPNVLVTVHPAGDTTTVHSRLTDTNGRFLLPRLPAGSYTVMFSVLGYTAVVRELVIPAEATGPVDMGSVALPPRAIELQQVDVIAERPAVVAAADRDIYSVDAMPVAGGTATDVLSNVAEVQLDVDGNVTLRGERPTIYINGRPAPMRGDALAQFLQGFPAENIETVEVMTNPSARYEAEGTGGIINIVLRRGASLGLNGNASVNGGTRGNIGANVRATYMRGDLTLIGGSSLRLTRTETRTSELRENRLTDPITFLGQDAESDRSTWSGNLDLSAEYALGENTDIRAEARLSRNSAEADRLTTYTEMDQDQVVLDTYDRLIADEGAGFSGDLALRLEHELGARNHEISFELQFQGGQDAEESFIRRRILQELGEIEYSTERTWEEDNETEREISLRADYTRPLGARGQLELGIRSEFGKTDERRLQEVVIEDGEPVTTLDRGFLHEQDVHATYLTVMQRLGDFSIQLGLRGEYASIGMALPDGEDIVGRSDFNVFPNANVTYNLGGGKRLRLAYSMRVQRPSSSVLNPTNTSDDPMNRRVGNPNIEPQKTHSITLDGSWSGALGTVRIAPFFRRSVDQWERFKTVDADGVSTTTYENLGTTTTLGSSFSLNVRDFHGIGGSINLSTEHQRNDWGELLARAPRSITSWSLQTNLNGRVSRTLNVQASMTYNPARDLPQGRRSSTFMTRLGVRQRLLDGRASLNINVTDPFELYRPTTRTTDQTFVETGRERPSARTATLSFSYTFGGRGRGGGGRPGGGPIAVPRPPAGNQGTAGAPAGRPSREAVRGDAGGPEAGPEVRENPTGDSTPDGDP